MIAVRRRLNCFRSWPRAAVVAIGNFDGMHIGHQAAISSAVKGAGRAEARSVVCVAVPYAGPNASAM